MTVQPTAEPDGPQVRDLLDRLRQGPAGLSEHTAASVVKQTWDALAAAIGNDDEQAGAPLVEAIQALQSVDRQLLRLEHDRASTRRLGDALARLEEADCTVAEVVQLAPRLICELGFERAIISHVADGLWLPETVFVVNDPGWSAEIARVGREQPQPLVPGLLETEIVRRRQAILVTGVQNDPRVHRPIADASQSRSYVAAPIVSRGKVVGFLHGDRFGQQREVDEADRELLVAFSEGLRMALSRAALAERLADTQQRLQALAGSLGGHDPRDISLGAAGRGLLAPVSVESPHDGGRSTATSNLTRRETEILELMATGLTNQRIARQLVVAESTVKQHVKHVLRKLGAANRAEAVALWFQARSERPAGG